MLKNEIVLNNCNKYIDFLKYHSNDYNRKDYLKFFKEVCKIKYNRVEIPEIFLNDIYPYDILKYFLFKK